MSLALSLTTSAIYRPIKKKQGVTAGIARTGAGRDGSVNHVDEKEAVRQILLLLQHLSSIEATFR